MRSILLLSVSELCLLYAAHAYENTPAGYVVQILALIVFFIFVVEVLHWAFSFFAKS